MTSNEQLITTFYTAFQKLDADTMAACYHPESTFFDPAFGNLNHDQTVDMWKMLCGRAKEFSLTFSDVSANEKLGSAKWIAVYLFSKTGRTVTNKISAEFEFRDGKIFRHCDTFDIWKWSSMALGVKGMLLGWSPVVKNAVRKEALKGLTAFMQKK